jgi:formylglycine-generating enzyme required for sulfatase activity
VCTPGTRQCTGNAPQVCDTVGQWQPGAACSGTKPYCSAGQCVAVGSSCSGLPDTCGDGQTNCCAFSQVVGGTFYRSYDKVSYLDQGYPATVSDFRLDLYEVTVGRFRKFLEKGAGTQLAPPAQGAGENPNMPGTGWKSTWDAMLLADTAALKAALKCPGNYTWTDTPAKETLPIGCVTWFEAFAFCIWDGGRLPTEAEWNYAAAGGGGQDGQRVYPWSVPSTSASIDASYAVFAPGPLEAVGSRSKGVGKWGHADLAGSVAEWTFDFEGQYPKPCTNCAQLNEATARTSRGGSVLDNKDDVRVSVRSFIFPGVRAHSRGIRCARL